MMTSSAPIYSLTEDAATAESSAWARFSAAKDSNEFCASWLAILCLQLERVGSGLLLLGPDNDGAYVPAAVWPHAGRDVKYLSKVAERALVERRGIVVAPDGVSPPSRDQRVFACYPIEVGGALHGAVVLDLAPAPDIELQRALRQLHWASAWLIDQFRQRALEEREARLERLRITMDVVATALQNGRFTPSAMAITNALASRLACDRVSLGIERKGKIEVKAISNTATFDPKLELARRIGEAMDEVLDLEASLVVPPEKPVDFGAMAHAGLAREFANAAVCSVPLAVDGLATGVLTFERGDGQPFSRDDVALMTTVGDLMGPIMAAKLHEERSVAERARSAIGAGAQALFGPQNPGIKLLAVLMAGLVMFCWFATGTYRVSARTVIEGAVQRVAAAPFEGYIQHSFVRAGDTVRAGQPMVRLDDRDLRLEQVKINSERDQLVRRQRQALATQDRAAIAIIGAQLNQLDAAAALVAGKIARATVQAPFDGVVVSGDLNQLLGTPVEQGKVLFQVAPLDSYRVILQVEERDIAEVQVGQRGELTLSGLLGRRLDVVVQHITPVSTAQDGRNFFRVEATLLDPPPNVRPGMEGVGKVVIGPRRLIWAWTHGFADWLRLFVWKWLP